MASTIQVQAAANEILASAREAAAAPAAATMAAAPAALVPADFCALWKQAKPVLELAATILAFIAPPVAGTLRGLIKIGDQIAQGMGCS
jgi:hypothetical protein